MRALWTAASGMKAQQLNVDTISNNLANVNTTGFKKQRVEFKDLLYETLSRTNLDMGEGKPVNLEVGHGVMPIATTRSFIAGNFEQTNSSLDFAIEGDGFFMVRDENDNLFYTRDGSFKLSILDDEARLVTSEGYFVQSDAGDVELGADIADIMVSQNGMITVKRKGEEEAEELGQLSLVTFANPAGLQSIGKNLYAQTTASGEAIEAIEGEAGKVIQGFLETSNVQVVEEMIKLITAQRAYEINSKSIQTADQMLEQANNLRR
ncbi:flagellar basal-body rod protein FlgG [Geosporobacter ferrireducens]|uniref:Flagellar basal-body rod protein FlgG n=1 Tax=Geosporobacter ferrireducens TaxID=1424294 RepID=A0A1D8GGM3_9FIRM|nr:flagellar basal-body rod protein FlgG [Geosporobacter ferrireducens]AOT70058.1 flagellar basal body rod protein FlgG [Geosporobacter ferrireducens]MTI53394.1 flagellar basal-body rod protein FlgG [Geosporobacter ferrireducens]